MKPLYELTKEFFGLAQQIENYIDERENVPDELEAMLEMTETERTAKILNIGRWIRSLSAILSATEAEQRRLKKKKETLENLIERLKEYLLANIKKGEKFEDGAVKVSSKMGPPALEITNELGVPAQYVKLIPKIDNEKLKNDILAGAEFDFARVVQRLHVQVR